MSQLHLVHKHRAGQAVPQAHTRTYGDTISISENLTKVHTVPGGITWPNEPLGSTLLSDAHLNGSLDGGWNNNGPVPFTTGQGAPSGDTNVLWEHHDEVTSRGGIHGYMVINGSPRQIYMGAYCKMSNPFAGYYSGMNKYFWVVDNHPIWSPLEFYGNPDRYPNQSAYPTIFDIPSDGGWDNSHLKPGSRPYDSIVLPGQHYHEWPVGEWMRVELYVKLSTSWAGYDGVVQWWVNGMEIGYYDTVNFGGTFFQQVEQTHTWDGVTSSPYAFDWFTDHIRVSIPPS